MSDPFQWNTEKAAVNLKKHGVSFAEAAAVFSDDNELVLDDERHSEDEQRLISIGKSGDRLLVVSYTERGDSIRIISARPAQETEFSVYMQQFQR